jgi:hypothetical protein
LYTPSFDQNDHALVIGDGDGFKRLLDGFEATTAIGGNHDIRLDQFSRARVKYDGDRLHDEDRHREPRV